MPKRVIPSYHPTLWTVYGFRPTRFIQNSKPIPNNIAEARKIIARAGIHKETMTTEDQAIAFAMKTLILYPASTMVVVRLDHGLDMNGERHVIARYGPDAKAWWE